MNAGSLFALVKDAFSEWNEDKAPRLAAALAYYTAFALAPLLLIAISIASFFYADADQQARNQIAALIPGGGDAITELLSNTNRSGSSGIAAAIGVVTLLFGAAGFFGQLQDALNTIWEVQPKPNLGIWEMIKQRFFSLTMVLGTGFLLLVSLLVSSGLSIVVGYFQNLLPGADIIWTVVSYLVNVVVATGIFALIFKVIPDVKVAWHDVSIGAVVTAVLFVLGQVGLGFYLANQQSAYGAFGSLIVLLLWVFYSAQILFFGAEFTQVYARRYGSRIEPADNAMPVSEASRENQGLPRTDAPEPGEQREVGAPLPTPAPAAAYVASPTPGAKPGAAAALVSFALGWMLGRRKQK